MSDLKLSPENRKAVYHSVSDQAGILRNLKPTNFNEELERADRLLKSLSLMSKISHDNYSEYRSRIVELGQTDAIFKHIEKDFD